MFRIQNSNCLPIRNALLAWLNAECDATYIFTDIILGCGVHARRRTPPPAPTPLPRRQQRRGRPTLIDQQRRRYAAKEGLDFMCVDVRHMQVFSRASFDIVIDPPASFNTALEP